jgi:integrase
MAKRRRTKRPYQISKHCACPDRQTCGHHWWLRVYANGTRQRIDLTEMFPDDAVELAAAKAKDLAKRGQVVDGQLVGHPSSTRLTFGDVADQYVKTRTSSYYVEGLRAIEVPGPKGAMVNLEDKPIDEVTTRDIKDHAVAAWRKRPRCGPVAIRHLLQTARHLFNWAIREGYASSTPFRREGVTLISVKPGRARTRRLEDGEETRILAHACPFIADFFAAMIETGCRPGELRTLQWSEVQGDHFVILPAKAKDREERKIPIMPALRKILDRRKLGPDGNELPPDAHVFGNETGEMLTRKRLCDLWSATCERAKVKNLHLHDLRGEAGSQLLEAGVPIHEVRDALGHSSTTMTSTYLRTRTNSLAKAYKQRDVHRARKAIRLAKSGQSIAKRKSS